jgi:hypothetical protein
VMLAVSNLRQASPRNCFTAVTSRRLLTWSDRVTVKRSPVAVNRPRALNFSSFNAFTSASAPLRTASAWPIASARGLRSKDCGIDYKAGKPEPWVAPWFGLGLGGRCNRPLSLLLVSHVHTWLSSPMSEEEQSERFQMRVSPSFLKAIDEWRRKQSDIPSRAEAIRRLVELGLLHGKGRSDRR